MENKHDTLSSHHFCRSANSVLKDKANMAVFVSRKQRQLLILWSGNLVSPGRTRTKNFEMLISNISNFQGKAKFLPRIRYYFDISGTILN